MGADVGKRKSEVKWINRSLVTSPYYIGLCTSEKKFAREMKRLKVPKLERRAFLKSGSDATTHLFDARQGRDNCAIVCIKRGKTKRTQVHSLLVHEAMHVWRAICVRIGEDTPSDEFAAYSVQSISQRLMEVYKK